MKLQAIYSIQQADAKGEISIVNPGEIFTVDEKEGARLIELGAACHPVKAAPAYEEAAVEVEADNEADADDYADDSEQDGDYIDDSEQEGDDVDDGQTDLESMDKKSAKKYAKEIGVKVKSDDNLDDIIAKIKAKLAEDDE